MDFFLKALLFMRDEKKKNTSFALFVQTFLKSTVIILISFVIIIFVLIVMQNSKVNPFIYFSF